MAPHPTPDWRAYVAGLPDVRVTSEREACDALRADAYRFSPDVVRIIERPTRRRYEPDDLFDAMTLEAYRDEMRQVFLNTGNFARCVTALQKMVEVDDLLGDRSIGLMP